MAALVLGLLILLASWGVSAAGDSTAGGGLPDFDVRIGKEGQAARSLLNPPSATLGRRLDLAAKIEAARQRLAWYVPGLVLEMHPVLGSPEVVAARGMFLTPPAPSDDAERIVRDFLRAAAPLHGLSPGEVVALRTTANYANPTGPLRWVTLEQRLNGIPVFRGELRAAVTADGEIAAIVSEIVPGLDPTTLGAPRLSPEQAIQLAADNIGERLGPVPARIERSADGFTHRFERGPFADDITVELMVFPLGPAKGVLAWRVLLWQALAAYYVVVDDASGLVLFRKNITADQSQTATFDVYASDSPAPLSPSNATPGSGIQGAATSRTRFSLVSELPDFDNLGWIPDGSSVTTGNNVDAGLDIDGVNGIDPDGRAAGLCAGPSPGCRNFTFAYNPPPGGSDPPTGTDARMGGVTDLFFWSNRYHDRLYAFGFTEAARNFQNDNFGRGGVGGDYVRAEAQDSSGTSNANFSTPADGTRPRMQMYVFTGPSPARDGGLDHDVVLHELTHGVSNRLIGNGSGLTNQQGRGMGEGWSDFYALSLLSEPGDDPNGVYAAGAYATYRLSPGFTDNYFYGIRRFPYTTNALYNPMTFRDVDPTQCSVGNGTYSPSPLDGTGCNNPSEVHNVGEVWALMLWEARANVIARLGGAAGNDRMLQVVTDGMKLTPTAPTFTQARNAIIQADCAGFAGADEIDLWRGFAKRGLGVSAVAPSSGSMNLTGVVEAFDLPLASGASVISDTPGGNGNGRVDPGETIDLTVPVSNMFTCTGLSNVRGTLTTATPGVTLNRPSANYGSLGAGTTANGGAYQFRVATSVPCGTPITFTLTLASAEGMTVTRTITMTVGQAMAGAPTTYAYSGPPVPIPDFSPTNPTGAAVTLTVPGAVVIGDVNLTLTNVTHTFIGDLVVQLFSPDGAGITLVNRIPNGTGGNSNNNFTNTVLDDEAVTSIQSQTGPVANARFAPANPLSGFDNRTGNGIWTLRILDQASGDVGTINAWSLTIVPATFSCVAFTPQPAPLTVTRAGSGNGRVTSSPSGIDCAGTCQATYDRGTTVTLTATAAAGSVFAGWSGGGCSGTESCTVTMTAATTVTATFTLQSFPLTVTRAGTGTGTVTSTPVGISCGATCSARFDYNTAVTLTATPATGSTFTGWSGGGCAGTSPCTVTMTAATAVTATFTLESFALTVTRAGTGTGTVTSTPVGIACGATCSAPFDYNTGVTLSAAPATGSTFTGWSGGGCAGTSPCTVTMTAATAVTATFTLESFPLTVTRAGTGTGTVTSTPVGITCGATCSAAFDYNTAVTLTATPATGSTFTGWSGDGCTGTATCTVTMTAATTVTATFTLQSFPLTVTRNGTGTGTVTSTPLGITCGATCSAPYDYNATVTLTAAPATGSSFTGWTGGGCSGTGTCTVTMTAATTVTATFTLQSFPLTVTRAGTGTGTVTSAPAGIACGATCSAPFDYNTAVTLAAAPATGSTFTGWSGAGCSGTGSCVVTVSAAASVTATFTLQSFTLTVTRSGTGTGTVTSTPAGITCGATCSAPYDYNTVVTLTAAPATGSTFTGWSGGSCSGTESCTVTMTAATTVTATFTLQSFTLTITRNGTGTGTVTSTPAGITCGETCSAPYDYNTVVTLTAAPATGSTFAGWSGGGCSGTGTCAVTVGDTTTVSATFTLTTPTSVRPSTP